MPRNGANVYAKPVGTTPIDGDDIDAAPFNLLMDDIATDLNTPRPVVAGGTGASNAPAALVSLGALSTASGLSDLLAPSKGLANLHGYATTAKSGGTTTLTAASAVYQRFTGSSAHSVVLPDAGTLQLGSFYDVHNNNAPGTLTVKSADGSTIITALPGQVIRLVCVLASGATAGSWGATLLGTDVLGNAAILASTNTTGTPSGRYLITAATGGVLPVGWLPANGGIIDILRGDAGSLVQLLYCGLTGRSATRHLVGGLWQPWREAITADQSPVAGDMMYFDGSNFLRLAKGTAGQALTMNSGATAPEWRQGIDASGAAPIYACRAWVNFDGTGVVAIRSSGNVASITDNGTGNYTVNFVTAMPHANYCAQVTSVPKGAGNNVNYGFGLYPGGIKTVSAVQVAVGGASNATGFTGDYDQVNVAIFC